MARRWSLPARRKFPWPRPACGWSSASSENVPCGPPSKGGSRRRLLLRSPGQPWGLVLLALACAGPALAEEPTPTEQKVAPSAFNRTEMQPLPGWGEGEGRSYWVPAAGIVLFDGLLNLYDRHYVEPNSDFRSNWDSIERNA